MNDQHIIFSPERNQWTLADGLHHMEVPDWAREIMRDEFERETRPMHDSLDLALDSKRIAERRVTELLDENAKLRELVRDMRTCIDHACMCEFCPLFVTEEDMDERRCIADVKEHMRELGIEVDGWKKARMRELGVEVE